MKALLHFLGILVLGSFSTKFLPAQVHPKTIALEMRLKNLAKSSNGVGRVIQIGVSRSGAPILAMEIARNKTEKRARPAALLVAGLDGRRHDDLDVALEVAKSFLSAKPSSPKGKILKTWTIWVVPSANPDGSLANVEGNLGPVDEDRDGRMDEDGPEDIDGDGQILWMRKKDPEGTYIQDSKTGLMRPADPKKGEAGIFKLWREGLDNDSDGDFNEDPKGGIIPNRNFPQLFPEHEKGAGPYVLSEPESLSLVDFVVKNPRIRFVITLGAMDNLNNQPKKNTATKKQPINGYYPGDIRVLRQFTKAIGRKGGGRPDEWKGRFHSWVYAHAGRISIAINLGRKRDLHVKNRSRSRPSSQPSRKNISGKKAPPRKSEDPGKGKPKFPQWKPFNHPQLGPIEIGGKDPLKHCKLSPQEKKEGVPLITKLLLTGSEEACRLKIVKLETKELGKGVLEVRAVVRNQGTFPSRTAVADRLGNPRLPRLEFVRLSGENPQNARRWGKREAQASLLTGKPFVFIPSRLISGQTAAFKWIIKKPKPGTVGLRITQEGIVFDIKEVK